jgi:uncharacterized protein YbjQ (UPF0145 family)
MLMTTTNTLEGVAIKQYLGIVSGEAILGANLVKDLFASVRDIVGGRSGAYEAELLKARDTAMREMDATALGMGANAIVGVDIDYEALGSGGSMLMVCVSGTAVVVGPPAQPGG